MNILARTVLLALIVLTGFLVFAAAQGKQKVTDIQGGYYQHYGHVMDHKQIY